MVEVFQQGSIFIYAILFVGFLVTLISIERALSLYFRFRLNAQKLFAEVRSALSHDDTEEALEACRERGQRPLARVLEAGIVRRGRSLEEIQLSMEAEASYQIPRILQRLSFLPSLGNLATLLGLVGTVVGLIKSFSAIGGQAIAGLNKGQALAAGVSESMYATAAGLIVAIPAIFIHLILAARAHRLIDDVDHYALELKKLLLLEPTPVYKEEKARDLKITEEQSVPPALRTLRQPFQEKSNAAFKLAMAVQQVTREAVVNEATEAIDRTEWLNRVVEEESKSPEIVAEEIRRLSQIELMRKVSQAAHAGAVDAMGEVSENRLTHPMASADEKKV